MKLKILAFVVGLAAATCAVAAPGPFELAGGYVGPIKIKFSNYENIDRQDPITGELSPCVQIAPGCINFGILDITQILNPVTNAVLYSKGDRGGFLSGVFNGIMIDQVITNGTNVNAFSTGGQVKIYYNSIPLDPTLGTGGYIGGVGSLQYNTVSNAGNLFLDLKYDKGCDTLGHTVCATFLGGGVRPFGGSVISSFLSVAPGTGTNNSMFDTNGQINALGGMSDLLSQNTFCPNGDPVCGGPVGDWQLLSDDPIRGAVRVPEPTGLALIGIALFGLGLTSRRRKN